MNQFIDRQQEMRFLNNEYQKETASFIVIYGRRRLGKTTLIREFIKEKPSLYYLSTKESEKENRNKFQSQLADFIGNSLLRDATNQSWEDLFHHFVQYEPETKKVLVIDEFQYIGKSNPAFISVMQKCWDLVLQQANVMLILCGSVVNMMYSQTLSYDSPLYGRRTGQIKLQQIPFQCYGEFYRNMSREQLVEYYGVTGGVPKYIESFEAYPDIFTAIQNSVFSKESYLYDEPSFLLGDEVADVGSYYSIIRLIASGKEQPKELAAALGVPQTSLPKYLKALMDLDILERRVPATEDKPEKSKLGLYKIKDNYLKFWFLFVYPYRSYLEMGNEAFVMKKLQNGLKANITGFVYEDICRKESMPKLVANETWDFTPTRIGAWWNRTGDEIDICAPCEETGDIIFGECKFTNEPVDVDVYYALLEKIKRVSWNYKTRKDHFVFFSFHGFTKAMKHLAQEENIVLIDGLV